MGQAYCGEIGDALVATIVNVSLGWAAVDSWKRGYPAGVALSLYMGIPFYFGNIWAASDEARQRNNAIIGSELDAVERSVLARMRGSGMQ